MLRKPRSELLLNSHEIILRKAYKMLVVEISVISVEKGDVLLRGTRLCIPNWIRKQVVDLAHKGHQGRVKSKSFLRETFEPQHGISKNMVCATSKGSDQPAHNLSLIRAFASRLNIL